MGAGCRGIKQGLNELIAVLFTQSPAGVQLNSLDCSFIGVLHDEIGERKPLETGCSLNTFFLLRKETGFGPSSTQRYGHAISPPVLYGNLPYIINYISIFKFMPCAWLSKGKRPPKAASSKTRSKHRSVYCEADFPASDGCVAAAGGAALATVSLWAK
jgi:hypothetical protein